MNKEHGQDVRLVEKLELTRITQNCLVHYLLFTVVIWNAYTLCCISMGTVAHRVDIISCSTV